MSDDYPNTDNSNDNGANGLPNLSKGQIIVGSDSGTVILPSATVNNYVLTYNSSTSTGLQWSAPGGLPSELNLNVLRFPFTSPTVRFSRLGADTLLLDQTTGDSAVLNVATLNSTNISNANTINIITVAGDINLNPAGNITCNNKDINGVRTLRAGTSVVTNTITSTNNTMSINPLIAANFNNKDITNVNALTATTINGGVANISAASNNAGTVLQIGNIEGPGELVETVSCIDLGRVVPNSGSGNGNTYGSQKIRVYSRDNGDFMGFSMNNNGAFISALGGPTAGSYFWLWTVNGVVRMNLTNAGQLQIASTLMTPGIVTATGDLSISPAGTNINVSNKRITNASEIFMTDDINASNLPKIRLQTSPQVFGIGMQNNTTMRYDAGGSAASQTWVINNSERMRLNNTSLIIDTPITNTSGNLQLNPVGRINCNNKALTNATLTNISSYGFVGVFVSDPFTVFMHKIDRTVTLRIIGNIRVTGPGGTVAITSGVLPEAYRPEGSDCIFVVFATGQLVLQLITVQTGGAITIRRQTLDEYPNGSEINFGLGAVCITYITAATL
jgi:hypothetical protein